jgi:hypothetical protein
VGTSTRSDLATPGRRESRPRRTTS